MTTYEVFGQTFGTDNGTCLTFRTVKHEITAQMWTRLYNALHYSMPNLGNARLHFDYDEVGQSQECLCYLPTCQECSNDKYAEYYFDDAATVAYLLSLPNPDDEDLI